MNAIGKSPRSFSVNLLRCDCFAFLSSCSFVWGWYEDEIRERRNDDSWQVYVDLREQAGCVTAFDEVYNTHKSKFEAEGFLAYCEETKGIYGDVEFGYEYQHYTTADQEYLNQQVEYFCEKTGFPYDDKGLVTPVAPIYEMDIAGPKLVS